MKEAEDIAAEMLNVARRAMLDAVESLESAQHSLKEADVARSKQRAYPELVFRQVADLDATISSMKGQQVLLDEPEVNATHISAREASGKISAADLARAVNLRQGLPSSEMTNGSRDGRSQCSAALLEEPKKTCRMRLREAAFTGAAELWSASMPCGPWGPGFVARAQTFQCPALCPGDWCGQSGGVGLAVLFGEVRLEVVGHALTAYANGSITTVSGESQRDEYVGNGIVVRRSCSPSEREVHACWSISHASGISLDATVLPEAEMPAQFVLTLALTTPESLATSERCVAPRGSTTRQNHVLAATDAATNLPVEEDATAVVGIAPRAHEDVFAPITLDSMRSLCTLRPSV